MTDWHVGMKVVRISEPSPMPGIKGCEYPKVGRVYTIREVVYSDRHEEIYLRLVEVVNPLFDLKDGLMEPAFWASRFRPVVSRPTSIAVFTAMLDPTRTKETV